MKDNFGREHKYLLPPLQTCIWCEGEGYEYIDCGDKDLNGYDYRDVCRCRKRHKKYKSVALPVKEKED